MPTSWVERTAVEVKAALADFVSRGGAPGAVVAFGEVRGTPGRMPVEDTRHSDAEPASGAVQAPTVVAVGTVAPECGDAPATGSTLYDVASLTKMIATWPLVGLAYARNLLDLDAPVGNCLAEALHRDGWGPAGSPSPPRLDDLPSAGVTVRQLLTHTSGLMVRTRLDRYLGATRPLAELICAEPLEWETGTRHKYISRGFLLLGLLLPGLLGQPFDHAAARLVWGPAGMGRTRFGPVGRGPEVAPTEQLLPAAPRVWGQVHDENARLLGGIAGHAGVFTTVEDLAAYAAWLLDPAAPLRAWFQRSTRREVPVPPSRSPGEGTPVGTGLARGLGWMVTGAGVAYHDGFTGPSLYLAPRTGRYLALCTNAIYGGRARHGLRALRERLLALVQAPPG